jgi:hypothetical protein
LTASFTYIKNINALTIELNNGGGLIFDEITAPLTLAAKDVCYGDSAAHAVKCRSNAGAFAQVVTELTGVTQIP